MKSFRLTDVTDTMNEDELEQRTYMKEHEKYHETDNARYALKHIKEEYFKRHWDTESHVQAIRYVFCFHIFSFTYMRAHLFNLCPCVIIVT